MSSHHYLFKFITLGSSSVGKSSLLLRFTEKKYKAEHDPTIGVEFGSRDIKINGKALKLQIWDTSGMESFISITRSYYRESVGALLVYDITNRESFENLKVWLQAAREANEKLLILLIGNKSDLKAERKVSIEEGKEFAKTNGMIFLEASSKTGVNVDAIFIKLSDLVLKLIEQGKLDPTTNEAIGIKLGARGSEPIENEGRFRCC